MGLFKKIINIKSKTVKAIAIMALLLMLVLATLISLSSCTMEGGMGKLDLSFSNGSTDASSSGSSNGDDGSNLSSDQIIVQNSGSNSESISTNDGINIDKQLLIIGSDTTYPPFEYVENGEIVGFDLDLIKEVALRMDKQIEIVPIEWDQNFKVLREGKVDIIISAVPYNIEKEDLVDYSQTYFNMRYLLVSLVGSDIKIKEDINTKKVGILEAANGSLDSDYLAKFDIVKFTDIMDMLDALKNKEIQAVLLSLPIAVNLIQANSDIYVVFDEIDSTRNFAIVFNEASSLKQGVDAALSEITQDGTLQEIYKKWFDSF